jgi:hypothetical protein
MASRAWGAVLRRVIQLQTEIHDHRFWHRMHNRLTFDQLGKLARLGRDFLLNLEHRLTQLCPVYRLREASC